MKMNVLARSCWVLLFLYSTVSLSSGAFYYLDNSLQCTSSSYGPTQDLEYMSETAYINAWTSSYNRVPVGSSCSMSISSYETNRLKYKFSSSSDFIGSGGAVLKIYKGLNTYGELLATYSSYSDLPTSYQHTDNWYITVELQNYQRSTNFDFELLVESYDKRSINSVGLAVGLSVGSIVFIIVIVSIVVFVAMRRRRNLARSVVVGTPGSSYNYNYPTGVAAYSQPNYGNPATSNYPPPPGYPGPPPPGSTGYPQAPPPAGFAGYSQPPPPEGTTGYSQAPPPAGSTGYPQAPAPAN